MSLDLAIPGYDVVELLGEGAFGAVYKVKHQDQFYAVKIMKAPMAASDKGIDLRREARALACLKSPHVVRIHELGEVKGREFLVMQYVEGVPLTQRIQKGLSEEQIISFAMQMAKGLNEVHRRGLIHRDVKPDNFLVSDAGHVTLIDFGFMGDVTEKADSSDAIRASLAYAAPEQIGALKTQVDSRSDLFSLGVTLYECLTKSNPYSVNSISDLITKHLSGEIPNLREHSPPFNSAIPHIVHKLLTTDPDDRYQTAEGLLNDLESIAQLTEQARSGKLTLGSRDRSKVRAQVPLVGRESETDKMLNTWKMVSNGRGKMLQVEGEGGLGKTRLVTEFLTNAKLSDATLIQGKCIAKDTIPFGYIRQAIEDFSIELERRSDENSDRLKTVVKKIATELNLQDLGVSRALSKLVSDGGKYDPKGAAAPEEFSLALQDFLIRLSEDRPLVLLVDDLQWIDKGSRQLLINLIGKFRSARILIVSTARNDAQSQANAESFLEAVQQSEPIRLVLKPLAQEAVGVLVKEFLNGPTDVRLVERIYSMSNGNPFAIIEYLRAMLDSGNLLPVSGEWKMDLNGLEKLDLPKDVVDLVVRRIDKIPAQSMQFLRLGALMSKFTLKSLAEIANAQEAEVISAFDHAIRENMIERGTDGTYNFIHDRITEALLSEMDDQTTRAAHEKIATWYSIQNNLTEKQTFEYAIHCIGGHLDKNPKRSFEVCSSAGFLALRQFVYQDAVKYFEIASQYAEILGETEEKQYPLLLGLGESLMMVDAHSQAQKILIKAGRLARTPIEKARVNYIACRSYCSEGKLEEGWTELDNGLKELGVPLAEYELLTFISVWGFLFCAIFIHVTGIHRFATKNEKTRQRRSLIVNLYRAGTTLAYHSNARVFLELFARFSFVGQLTGKAEDFCESTAICGWMLAYLFPKSEFGLRMIRGAGEKASVLGNRATYAECLSHTASAVWAMGRLTEAEQLYKESHSLRMRYTDAFQRGRDFAVRSVGRLVAGDNRAIAEFPMADRPLVDAGTPHLALIYYSTIYVSYILCDQKREALEISKIWEDFAAKCRHDQANMGWPNWMMLHMLYEQNDFGRKMDQLESGLINGIIKNGLDELFVQSFGLPTLGYIAIRRIERAPDEVARANAFKHMRDVLGYFRQRGMVGWIQRAHYHNILGCYYSLKNKKLKAWGHFEKAFWLAEKSDSHWTAYSVCLEYGRFQLRNNSTLKGQALLKTAFRISLDQKWMLRTDSLMAEFDFLRSEKSRSEELGRSTVSTSTQVHLAKRYIDALLRITLASTAVMDPEKQAANTLDELINLMGAERGFLFLVDPADSQLKVSIGRDSGKRNLPATEAYATSFVKKVVEDRVAVVSTNNDIQGLNASESIVINDLRSIMAAPLQINDKFIGVVYLDSRMSKGLFTKSDGDVLTAVAAQICIFFEMGEKLELAKELEVQKATAEMRRDIQVLVDNMKQSLFSVTPDGNIVSPVSQFSTQVFGEEIFGKRVLDVLYKDLDRSSETFSKVEGSLSVAFGEDEMQWSLLEDNFPRKVKYVQTTAATTDRNRVLKVSTAPLWDQQSNLEKLMFVVEDVSELEKLEADLAIANRKTQILQELMREDGKDPVQILDQVSAKLTSLERQMAESSDKSRGNIVIRELHTMKGNARLYKLDALSECIHAAEGQLTAIDPELAADKAKEVFLKALSDIKERTGEYQEIAAKFLGGGRKTSAAKSKTDVQTIKAQLLDFKTMVSDLATELKKEVKFDVTGSEFPVEPALSDAIRDFSGHIIRNSLDHGIESPLDRKSKGKAPQGSLSIKLKEDASDYILEFQDDGAGIDPNVISAIALKRGVLSAEELSAKTDQEKVELIFLPNFSTKAAATDISGRGFGMDAVKDLVIQHGGTIQTKTSVGKGTTFTIRIPKKKTKTAA